MNLNKLRDEAYSVAKANGWHEEEHSDEHWLMLVITEIAEAVQADRKDKHADVDQFKEYQTYYGSFLPSKETQEIRFREDFEAYIKNSVEDELADVVIRCLDLCGLQDIDLSPVNKHLPKCQIVTSLSFPEIMFNVFHVLTLEYGTLAGSINYAIAIIICYCKQKDIDLDFFILAKMRYNRLRGYRHGGRRY